MKYHPSALSALAAAPFFFLAAILSLESASATPANAGTPPSSANGQKIFAGSCASCHDAHSTTPKVGIGLHDYYRRHTPRPTDASVRTVIQQGKGAMPAFPTLNQSQTDDLIAYLRTL